MTFSEVSMLHCSDKTLIKRQKSSSSLLDLVMNVQIVHAFWKRWLSRFVEYILLLILCHSLIIF